MKYYKIRCKEDGLFYTPAWGKTRFTPMGKIYNTKGHAKSAVTQAALSKRCQIVEYLLTETSSEDYT